MRRVSAAIVALTAAALVLTATPALAARSRSFNVNPKTVRAGQEVKVFGEGCDRGKRAFVRIYLDGVKIDDDRADRKGRFVDHVEIPNSVDPGKHRMKASCSGRRLGSVEITVKRSHFNVTPKKVMQGGFITVSGSGCKPGSNVVIKLDNRAIGHTRADENGKFSESVQIPKKTRVGRHTVSAKCRGRFVGSKKIKVINAYPAPKDDMLTVSRSSVPAGQAVTINGTDCPDKAPSASLDGRPVALKMDKAAKGKGFTATAAIPRETAPGKHKLLAGCEAGSAGTTELNVLDPETTESAAERQPFDTQTGSGNLAIWAGLVAGIALLFASITVGRRRRS
jgi:hypothetical protein